MLHEIATPDWVKHAVFYQIFPDRFSLSKRIKKPGNLEAWESPPTIYGFKGGDIAGIEEKLDYLVDLGINAIYLNPIFQSAASHRYHTHDYYQVDPILGGNQVFEDFLHKAHQRGIYIILDGVFNHASRGFFQFNHILENGSSSPYIDWFTIKEFPLNPYGPDKPNYKCWENLAALPEFKTSNPEVRDFIFDIARYWLEKGIDGWRLDVPFCIDDDSFWQEFRLVVKSINPEAYILGEIPWEAQRWLQGDQFDAVMNYQFTLACLGFFGNQSLDPSLSEGVMGFTTIPTLDASNFARRMMELINLYPEPISQVQLNLLSSHDMPRFSSICSFDKAAYRLATLFQMTYPGAPCIYYGDEIGLKNGPSRIPEDCRYTFPWDSTKWDVALQAFIRKCISIRKSYPALRIGEIKFIYAKDAIIMFTRKMGNQLLLILINNNPTEISSPIIFDEEIPDLKTIRQLKSLLGESYPILQPDGLHNISLPSRTGEIYLVEE